jgi:hypothetical protein
MNITMKKTVIILSASLALNSCGQTQSDNKQENAVLDEIVKYMEARADEYALYSHQSATEFVLGTKVCTDEEDTKEFFETRSIKRKPNKEYIGKLVTVEVLEYSLFNEKGENLQFDERYVSTKFSSGGGLIVEGEKVYEPLQIKKDLKGSYETLKGTLKLRFTLPKNNVREIEIPVNISVYEEDQR